MSDASLIEAPRGLGARGCDHAALVLSGLCLVHCLSLLALPVLPLTTLMHGHHGPFHLVLLLTITPLAAAAMLIGWRGHRRYEPALLAGVGIALLGLGLLAHEVFALAVAESLLTVAGSLVGLLAHGLNLRYQRELSDDIADGRAASADGTATRHCV